MTVMVLIRSLNWNNTLMKHKLITFNNKLITFNKIVLTILSIAISLYQQTVNISSRFQGLHFETILSDSLGVLVLTCYSPSLLEKHALMHWLLILIWFSVRYDATPLQSVWVPL